MTLTITLGYALAIAMALANTCALYWFGFGLWPRDWIAVVVFGFVGRLATTVMYERLEKERKGT